MRTPGIRISGLILTLITFLIIAGSQASSVFADPPLPLPRMPICGDQDGSEFPLVINCTNFAPIVDVQTFQVPGTGPVDLRFDFVFREAIFDNELGFFLVDDPIGTIGGLQPGDPGYLATAMAQATVIFPNGSTAFTPDVTINFNGGDILVFFIIQDDTLANFIANNPDNDIAGSPVAFFSLDSLAPDEVDHFVGFISTIGTGNLTQFGFENVSGGGDLDYDDVVYNIQTILQPFQPDSDGDGLPDDWEINGVDTDGDGRRDLFLDQLDEVGDDIPPNPLHKDIYVWVDWLVREDGAYNHAPDDRLLRAFSMVKEAFANAPAEVDNPDGQPGINLHIKIGNAIEVPASGEFDELGSVGAFTYVTDEFMRLKRRTLSKGEAYPGVFRYALYAHYLPEFFDPCPKGESLPKSSPPGGLTISLDALRLNPGTDFIVCHQCYVDGDPRKWKVDPLGPVVQGVTFMHELGHTLGMGEGGFISDGNGGVEIDQTKYKPNHLSVMNYSFIRGMFEKIPGTDALTVSKLDYSRFDSVELPFQPGQLLTLDENGFLLEEVGLSGGAPLENLATFRYNGRLDASGTIVKELNKDIDWNGNREIDQTFVKENINGDSIPTVPLVCLEKFSSLQVVNEWRHLSYKRGNIGKVSALIEDLPTEALVEEPDLPLDEISEVALVWMAKSVTPDTVNPGGTVTFTIELGTAGSFDEIAEVISDTLPSGFVYQPGSTSGVTVNDPAINGQQLAWSGPSTLVSGDILRLSFKATASITPGTYFNNVEASGTNFQLVQADAAVVVLRKTYLPLILKNFDGAVTPPTNILQGTVTDNGIPFAGTELLLRYNDGSTWSTYATTTTDFSGNYLFSSLPNLGPDQELYVLWLNNSADSDQLSSWSCSILSSSTADPSAYQCSFDVDNIDLLSPDSDVSVSLPQTFSWNKRPITTDDYEVNLIDISDFDPWWWTDPSLGYVDSYTLSGLPSGFLPGEQYGWFMGVRGANGVGFSYNYHVISFSPTGVSQVEALPLPDRIFKENIEPIALPRSR